MEKPAGLRPHARESGCPNVGSTLGMTAGRVSGVHDA